MRNSKRIKIVAGGTAALFGVGVAFAAWTSTGTGAGSVTAGNAASLTVAQQGSAVTGLYPTGSKQITVRVTNTNSYPISVSSVSPGPVQISGGAGCTAENALVTFEGVTGASDYLAPAASKDYLLDVVMGADSHNGCQGVTFSSTYTATGASTAVVAE